MIHDAILDYLKRRHGGFTSVPHPAGLYAPVYINVSYSTQNMPIRLLIIHPLPHSNTLFLNIHPNYFGDWVGELVIEYADPGFFDVLDYFILNSGLLVG